MSFEHQAAELGGLSLNAVTLRSHEGFKVRKAGAASYYSFQFIRRGRCELEGDFGRALAQPGDVFVLDPEHIVSEQWHGDCEQFLVRIERESLERMLCETLGRRVSSRLRFQPVSRDPGIFAWVQQLQRSLSGERRAARSLVSDRRVATQLEPFLSIMLLTGLEHSAAGAMSRPGPGPAPYYVKRAEEFIRARFADDITMDEIAAAGDVSVRSIFYGFRRWRDTTPMAYLREVRLEVAREELRGSDRGRGAVSAAALAAGFTNFGQFSRLYRARFGEKPSDTLVSAAI